jgi:glutamyl-tRNA synthetase
MSNANFSYKSRYYKTRLAPTPSGFLHLGNILSFAITATLARERGAKILLRIDDLDQVRASERYIEDIFDTLFFLGFPFDEGPKTPADFKANFSQLRRMDLYAAALNKLADDGTVYACTCSRRELSGDMRCRCELKQIPLSAPGVSWRLKTVDDSPIRVKTINNQYIDANLPAEMQEFIVKKKDGFPAYQLTSVVDDIHFETDLVVRGADLWPSTVAQTALAIALGKKQFGEIAFYHHDLLVSETGTKLSKSAGATSIQYLRREGRSRADIFHLIAGAAGMDQPASNWSELGMAFLGKDQSNVSP